MEIDAVGSEPIAGDNPAGSDVRGSAEFEALQAEIDRPNDTANPGQIDWSNVIKLGTGITATQGKDLLVGSYLAVGLIHQHQVPGFALGLKVLRDMIVTHWDGLFPPARRMRGRRNALQYWLDQCDELIRALSPPPLEPALVEAMLQHVDDIDAVLREKDDEPPGVFRLSGLIKGFPLIVEEAQAPEPSESSADTRDSGAATGLAQPGPPRSLDEAIEVAGTGLSTLRMAGDFLLEADLTHPLPYRISRWSAWSMVSDLPYADGGTTMLQPPHYTAVDAAAAMAAAGEHEAMVRFVEAQLPENALWLDLNRMQAQALEAMGEAYVAAASAVRMETTLLVVRLPGIEQLRFSDGMTFASAETLEWLAASATGGGGGASAGQRAGPSKAIQEAISAAAGLVAEGNLPGAMAVLQRGINQAPLARDRFHARVSLCSHLIEQQAVPNPWPYVRGLLDDIDRHRLDEWDPALAISGLRLVYSALAASGDAAAAGPLNADDILQRIARIDCAQALEVSGVR